MPVPGVEVDDPAVVLYRQLVPLQAGVGESPGREGLAVAELKLQGPVEVPDRLVVAAQGDAPAPERRGVVGVEPQHGVEVAQRGLVCSQVDVGDSPGVEGEPEPLFKLDGGVEVPERPVVIAAEDDVASDRLVR